MANTLWRFTDTKGSFESKTADRYKTLYFPIANEHLMSSVTPDLHGDCKAGQDAFVLEPVSRIDLVESRSSRNFWIETSGGAIWSATGVSKDIRQMRADEFTMRGGLLWHECARANKGVGLKATVLSFVPVSGETVEVMHVTVENISSRAISFTPTAAIPLYGRSAHNSRDHRHVTSLLQRPTINRFGVTTKPTLVFDEAGHHPNKTTYFVLGWDEKKAAPQHFYPTEEIFCGDGGDLEAPDAIFRKDLPKKSHTEGEEPMGAFQFSERRLRPGQRYSYTILIGLTDNASDIRRIITRFGTPRKVASLLNATRKHWVGLSERIGCATGDADFDNWLRWVAIQPTLRKIYGCSFLPDFDYGKGGRGWRDLWQDCLGLILSDPAHVGEMLVDNFCGVRIDGSNATIIGKNSGEFIADRNNISRTWMDHGVWPLITVDLYIEETGDIGVLFKKTGYFRNHEVDRASAIDHAWTPSYGRMVKTSSGAVYKGTVLEHLLIQNLVQFFNVGAHNYVRLEGADWNDGLDMARDRGESIAFSAMYAHNLSLLADIIGRAGVRECELAEEVSILCSSVDYASIAKKRALLERYFTAVRKNVSGKKIRYGSDKLVRDLRRKSQWMMEHIKKNAWLREGFFNGYYDNKGRRVEGETGGIMRMMLASQVFPVMSGAADDGQIARIVKSVERYIRDKKSGGYRLNTNFGSEQNDLGRAFSFIYGDKENGAFFNHMVVMYAYALYKRGYGDAAWRVFSSIYRMALDTDRSKIYPCLPEYFNGEGRGMYAYLTGSASWFMLTMLTEMFGVKGEGGDLAIEPKLAREQFAESKTVAVHRVFAGRKITVRFSNPDDLPYGEYKIIDVQLNGKTLIFPITNAIRIPRNTLRALSASQMHTIDILLG